MKRVGVVVLAAPLFLSLTVSAGLVWGAPMHSFRSGGHFGVHGFHPGGFHGGFHHGFHGGHFHHFHHGHFHHGGHFFFGVGVGAFVTAPFWYPWYGYPVYSY